MLQNILRWQVIHWWCQSKYLHCMNKAEVYLCVVSSNTSSYWNLLSYSTKNQFPAKTSILNGSALILALLSNSESRSREHSHWVELRSGWEFRPWWGTSGGGGCHWWMPPKHTSPGKHRGSALPWSSPTNRTFKRLLDFTLPATMAETARSTQGREVQPSDPQCWDPWCLLAHGKCCSAPLLPQTPTDSQMRSLGWGRQASQGKKGKQEPMFSVVCKKMGIPGCDNPWTFNTVSSLNPPPGLCTTDSQPWLHIGMTWGD